MSLSHGFQSLEIREWGHLAHDKGIKSTHLFCSSSFSCRSWPISERIPRSVLERELIWLRSSCSTCRLACRSAFNFLMSCSSLREGEIQHIYYVKDIVRVWWKSWIPLAVLAITRTPASKFFFFHTRWCSGATSSNLFRDTRKLGAKDRLRSSHSTAMSYLPGPAICILLNASAWIPSLPTREYLLTLLQILWILIGQWSTCEYQSF